MSKPVIIALIVFVMLAGLSVIAYFLLKDGDSKSALDKLNNQQMVKQTNEGTIVGVTGAIASVASKALTGGAG